jgi:hypothetical protein
MMATIAAPKFIEWCSGLPTGLFGLFALTSSSRTWTGTALSSTWTLAVTAQSGADATQELRPPGGGVTPEAGLISIALGRRTPILVVLGFG